MRAQSNSTKHVVVLISGVAWCSRTGNAMFNCILNYYYAQSGSGL